MRQGVRLKRRASTRLKITGVLVIMVLFFLGWVIFVKQNAMGVNELEYTKVIVKTGDTLWEIAKEYGPPDRDIRRVVFEIRKFNNLEENYIYPGQVIQVPKF